MPRRSLDFMITTDGERVKPSIATTRHGERARVMFPHGRPGTSPIRSQLEGTIVESLAGNRLTLEIEGRHKSIHLSRIQQVTVITETAAVSTE
jgi:hypothetical protein